jgi:hypothetical protein
MLKAKKGKRMGSSVLRFGINYPLLALNKAPRFSSETLRLDPDHRRKKRIDVLLIIGCMGEDHKPQFVIPDLDTFLSVLAVCARTMT